MAGHIFTLIDVSGQSLTTVDVLPKYGGSSISDVRYFSPVIWQHCAALRVVDSMLADESGSTKYDAESCW